MEQVDSVFATSVRALLQVAQAYGLSRDALLKQVSLSVLDISEPEMKVATSSYYQLFSLVADQLNDDNLGLYTGRVTYINSQSWLLYMSRLCTTLRDFLNLIPSIVKISGDIGVAKVVTKADLIGFEWQPKLTNSTEQRFLSDIFLSQSVCMLNSVCYQPIDIIDVSVTYAKPDNCQQLNRFFGNDIQYSAPSTCFYVPREALNYRISQLEFDSPIQLAKQAQQLFSEQQVDSFLQQLRDALLKLLPHGQISANDVAEALNISKRTLHRRLADRDCQFGQVVTDLRQELAKRYLRDQRLNLTEIAFLLGYSEQSTFSSAFKQWFNCSPGRYREQL